MVKALLIYPEYPDTFWSFKYALSFINKKAAYPPLGLLTVASLLPESWEKRLVDLNIKNLTDTDLEWADYAFISAMAIQKESTEKIIASCQKKGVKVAVGGPLFTSAPEDFPQVDHLILDEAEITLPMFLKDLESGNTKKIYNSDEKPALEETPLPMWSLINMDDYAVIGIQYSRGCPFDCEFCDITYLFGRKCRLKTSTQVINELDCLHSYGWRGSVFIVDDNFIGNKGKLKKEVLPAIINWMEENKHPFSFITEASINLADDDTLLEMMREAGFVHVFVGIETPSKEGLIECSKFHNTNRNLISSVKKIQNCGMQVSGGFILGFDSDTYSIFDKQINFIQKSGIVTAMVGLLNAPKGTRLFKRMEEENRLLPKFSGNNTDFSLNFMPKMDYNSLIEGYRYVVTTIYDPAYYYNRMLEFFEEFQPSKKKTKVSAFRICYLKALFKAMFYFGIIEKGRSYYWKMIIKTILKYPRFFPEAIIFSIYGFHFRKIFNKHHESMKNY